MSRRRSARIIWFWDRRGRQSSLDELAKADRLDPCRGAISSIFRHRRRESRPAAVALFKALLLSVWYDLSDANSPKRSMIARHSVGFCGFSATRRRAANCVRALFAEALDGFAR